MPGGPGGFGRGSSCPALLRVPPRGAPGPPTGLSPPAAQPSSCFGARRAPIPRALLPRAGRNPHGLGSSPFARRYSGNHGCLLLLRLLGCFGSPGSPPSRGARPAPGGLPHSDTTGSRAMCASPVLFAACRVLHRLREPGHPPCALPHFPRARAAGLPPGAAPRGSLSPLPRFVSRFSLYCLPRSGPSGGP